MVERCACGPTPGSRSNRCKGLGQNLDLGRVDCRATSGRREPEKISEKHKMPPITVNWSDLEIAFERNSPDQESFLDLENGALLAIIEGEPAAAARRSRVASHPDRFLRVDP